MHNAITNEYTIMVLNLCSMKLLHKASQVRSLHILQNNLIASTPHTHNALPAELGISYSAGPNQEWAPMMACEKM